jgi:hypothetical protein
MEQRTETVESEELEQRDLTPDTHLMVTASRPIPSGLKETVFLRAELCPSHALMLLKNVAWDTAPDRTFQSVCRNCNSILYVFRPNVRTWKFFCHVN